jgi:hypothetical protein
MTNLAKRQPQSKESLLPTGVPENHLFSSMIAHAFRSPLSLLSSSTDIID